MNGSDKNANAYVAMLGDKRDLDRVAHVTDAGGRITFAALNARIAEVSGFLAERLAPRDRVVLALDDSPAFVEVFWATIARGGIAVPVSPDMPADHWAHILADCRPRVVVHAPDRVPSRPPGVTAAYLSADALRSLSTADPVVVRSGDPALIQYTSGTTGTPKGVVHAHRGLVSVGDAFPVHLGLGADDVVFSSAKVSFGYGLGNTVLFPATVGAASILVERRVPPVDVPQLLAPLGCTVLCSGPRLFRTIVHRDAALPPSIRVVVSAGEAMPRGLSQEWTDSGRPRLVDGLGLTEALHIVVATTGGASESGTIGRAVPEVEARADAAPGEDGELVVRGPQVGLGYWSGAGDRPWRPFLDGEGWLRTGDVVRDDGGTFTFLGRRDQVVKVGGMKVSVPVVESGLEALDGVLEAAVVPIVDGDGFAQLVAFVTTTQGTNVASVRRRYAAQVPTYHVPRLIRVVDELPRTNTGKLDRRQLAAVASGPPSNNKLERIP